MKKLLNVLVIVGLVQSASLLGVLATGTTSATNKHNLSTTGPAGSYHTDYSEICVFCHTPHGARIVTGFEGLATNQLPLWNRTAPASASYGIYQSATMNVVPTTFGGGDNSSSALCMSCHDGTIAVGTLVNYSNLANNAVPAPNNMITGTANLGNGATALSNDHPVNFLYATSAAGDSGIAATAPATAPLFAGFMQCATCHNPHDNAFPPFLRTTNAASALCTGCHINK